MKIFTVSLVIIMAALVSACSQGPKSAFGFRLPNGDVDKGKEAFIMLNCTGCHQITDLKIAYTGSEETQPVWLGGKVSKVDTYGQLVTSIINPSHKIAKGYPADEITIDGESRMAFTLLNTTMTVQQLIDLVAFLQVQYEVQPPDIDPYMIGHH